MYTIRCDTPCVATGIAQGIEKVFSREGRMRERNSESARETEQYIREQELSNYIENNSLKCWRQFVLLRPSLDSDTLFNKLQEFSPYSVLP